MNDWKPGDIAWYNGDNGTESQIVKEVRVVSADTVELWFDKTQRINWIDSDVAYHTKEGVETL